MKTCKECKKQKLLIDFYTNKTYTCGYLSKCIDCVKQYRKKPEVKLKTKAWRDKYLARPDIKERNRKQKYIWTKKYMSNFENAIARSQYLEKYFLNNKEKTRLYHHNWGQKNKVEVSIKRKKRYRKNRKHDLMVIKKYHLLYNYGITLEQKEEILKSQSYKCAICNKDLVTTNRNTHVDHDHATGKVRAVLCLHCNSMLGHAKDNIKILKSGIKYLKLHSTPS